ncbi:ABC transporter substrate binding protein [Chitinivibrio alkaliphilus]|nr:ABC transporter substrate binding protein [Chitinivibrio alkaliphilus]
MSTASAEDSLTLGVAWMGRSRMSKRYLQGIENSLAQAPLPIRLKVKGNLPHEDALDSVISQFETTCDAMILLRSSTVRSIKNRPRPIPTFIGATTHPVKLGVAPRLDSPETNLAGVSYYVPAALRLSMFREVLPTISHYILLVEKGHPAAEIDVEQSRRAAQELSLTIKPLYCDTLATVLQSIDTVPEDYGILLGSQALLMDNAKKIIEAAPNTPFFSYADLPVEYGALAGFSANDIHMGQKLGSMVVDVLTEAVDMDSLGIILSETPVLHFNHESLKRFSENIPQVIKNLAETQEYLDGILAGAPVGIGVVSEGVISHVNTYILEHTGYSQEHLMGKPKSSLYPTKESYRTVMDTISSAMKRGDLARVETKWIDRTAQESDILLSVTPTMRKDPHKNYIFTALDITARKEQEAFFKSVFENTEAVTLLICPETGIIHDANPAAESFYGWPLERLRQKRIQDINTLSDEAVKQEMAHARSRERVYFEFTHRLHDGSLRDVAVFSSDVHHKGETYLFSIIHDITEVQNARHLLIRRTYIFIFVAMLLCVGMCLLLLRFLHTIDRLRETEGALRKSQQKLSTLFSSMTEMVVLHTLVYDAQGSPVDYRITDSNDAFIANTGIPREKSVGRYASEVYGTTPPPYLQEYAEVVKTKEPHVYTRHYQPLEKHFAISAVPLEQDDFATVTTDITAMKEVEEVIKRKNRELENYLYVASHDLRTPLVNIEGFSRLVHTDITTLSTLIQDSSPRKEDLHTARTIITESLPKNLDFIHRNVQSSNALINGLLQVSRTGRQPMNITEIAMDTLVTNVFVAQQFQLNQVNATYSVEITHSCYGDETLLMQIFTNLISNSIKYRSEERPLHISVTSSNRFKNSLYTYTDTGRGISEKHLQRIWDVFYRGDAGTDIPGEGLGLSIIKRIIEKHRGSITCYPNPEGGVQFDMELPGEEFTEI